MVRVDKVVREWTGCERGCNATKWVPSMHPRKYYARFLKGRTPATTMSSHDPPTVLVLGLSGRPQAVLQEILQAAGLDVRTTTRPAQALMDQQNGSEPAELLLVDEAVLDDVAPLMPRPFESAPTSWPSTVVLSTTLDAPVERLAPTLARLGKPVEPALLLRELHVGLPTNAKAPRFDVWHGGLVLLVGERLSEDAAWYEALEVAGFEATTAPSVERACELCEQIRFDLVLAEAGDDEPNGGSEKDTGAAHETGNACLALLRFRKSFGLAQPVAALVGPGEPSEALRDELHTLGAELILNRAAKIDENLESIGNYLHRLDRARGEEA